MTWLRIHYFLLDTVRQNKRLIVCVKGCKIEWYHYECVGLTEETVPDGSWHCPTCREKTARATSTSKPMVRFRVCILLLRAQFCNGCILCTRIWTFISIYLVIRRHVDLTYHCGAVLIEISVVSTAGVYRINCAVRQCVHFQTAL